MGPNDQMEFLRFVLGFRLLSWVLEADLNYELSFYVLVLWNRYDFLKQFFYLHGGKNTNRIYEIYVIENLINFKPR